MKKSEQLEAALAGAGDLEARSVRHEFETLIQQVVKPAFSEFKSALRDLGRDAAIIASLWPNPVQSIGVTLLDRYLKLEAGKTLALVNPKEEISKRNNSKYYEVYMSQGLVHIRQRANPLLEPIITQVPIENIVPKFLENELASFFERAYPAGVQTGGQAADTGSLESIPRADVVPDAPR